MALQKAKAQLKGKRGLRDISGLENLEGDASIISVLLNIHLGNDATDSLKELSKSDSDLADAFTDLIQLRNGVANDWDKSRSLSGDDELSLARKQEAWKLMPSETSKLSSTDIQEGLDTVSTPQQRESLTWLKLSALVREGSTEEALELLKSQNVEPDADMETLIPIVKKLGEEAFSWLASQIENLAEEGTQLRHEISVALTEVSAAARSVRVLADFIEQHPDAILRGRVTRTGGTNASKKS